MPTQELKDSEKTCLQQLKVILISGQLAGVEDRLPALCHARARTRAFSIRERN